MPEFDATRMRLRCFGAVGGRGFVVDGKRSRVGRTGLNVDCKITLVALLELSCGGPRGNAIVTRFIRV